MQKLIEITDKKLPLIGTDDYIKLASGKFICIDKTLFIPKFMSGDEVTLITFPRRWNKTTNLTMVEAFLSNHPDNRLSSQLFNDKNIARVNNGSFLKEHQGQYPVIFLTMKGLSVDDELSFINSLIKKIRKLYKKHSYLLDSVKMEEDDKEQIKKYRSGDIDKADIEISLELLSEYLARHWGKKVFILIDEYDAPINEAYNNYLHTNDFQKKQNLLNTAHSITRLIKNFFGAALKSNPNLEKGLMTGILRVSKNKMLSDLNNLVVYGSLEDRYAEFFGFTEEEVRAAFAEVGIIGEVFDSVRHWYNGYLVSNLIRYNPWSVMRCLRALIEKASFPFQCYWVQTGSIDVLIKRLMFDSDEATKTKITNLIAGNNNEKLQGITITENLVYEDLLEESSVERTNALFTILFHAGYLTATNVVKIGVNYLCDLSIPNREVRANFEEIFSAWLRNRIGHIYSDISKHLLEGNIAQFTSEFRQALLRVFSLRDLGLERDYQMMLGTILAGIQQTHIVESNREAGDGYPDFVIIPKQGVGTQGIIIELKRLSSKIKEKAKDLDARKEQLEYLAVEEGLKQIEERYRNDAFQNHQHITTVLRLGIACSSKQVVCAYYTVSNDEKILVQADRDIQFCYGFGDEQDFEQEEKESALKKQKQQDIEQGSDLEDYVLEEVNEGQDIEEEQPKRKSKREGGALGELAFLGSRSRKQGRHNDDDEDEAHSASLSYAGSENSN